jgi:hypothetical protein
MLQAILVWAGLVMAMVLLLVMALGPVIVEIDSWFFERRHNRKARRTATSKAEVRATRRVPQPVA